MGQSQAFTSNREPEQNFFELGVNYACGRKVAADLIEAHKWFNIAAMRGDIEAARRRQEIASEMSAFTSKQVLLQAGVSMLAQANQMPQTLLRLFQ